MIVMTAQSTGLFALVSDSLLPSWAARTQIWSFAADAIGQRPFLGWGVDASRTFGPAIPLHPHDAPLQLWLELGLPGVLIACAFWLVLGRRLSRLTEARPAAGQFAAATAAAYFTVGALSFGVWQEWWLAVGALAFVACALAAKVRPAGAPTLSEIGFRAAPHAASRQTLPEEADAV
jgi:O-antigen ligase